MADKTDGVPLPFSPIIVSEWNGPAMTDRKYYTVYTEENLREYAQACIAEAIRAMRGEK